MSTERTKGRGKYGMDRTERVTFRMTEGERDEVARMAEAAGLSIGTYIRRHLLTERVTVERLKR